MKKNKFLVLILMTFMFFAYQINVKAYDVIREVGDKVYHLTLLNDYAVCYDSNSLIISNAHLIGVLDNNKLFFYDEETNTGYIKNLLGENHDCSEITNQETINAFKKAKIVEMYTLSSDGDLYIQSISYLVQGFVKTEDSVIDSSKTYYTYDSEEEEYALVSEPSVSNIGTYYELLIFNRVTDISEIDNELDYYQCSNVSDFFIGSCLKVTTPNIADINDYMLVADEEDVLKETKIASINISDFPDAIVNRYAGTNEVFDIVKISKEYILGFYNDSTSRFEYYKLDGTLYDYRTDSSGFLNLFGADNGTIFSDGYSNKFGENQLLLDTDGEEICNFSKSDGVFISEECGLFIEYVISVLNISDDVAGYLHVGLNTDDMLIVKTYYTSDGANQTYDNKDLTIKFNGDLDKLTKVLINNVELDKKYYTTKSGSTIITINKDYLSTLKPGNYSVKAEYSDGAYARTTFKIAEANPKTLDNIMLYIVIGMISLFGCVILTYKFKNRNCNK